MIYILNIVIFQFANCNKLPEGNYYELGYGAPITLITTSMVNYHHIHGSAPPSDQWINIIQTENHRQKLNIFTRWGDLFLFSWFFCSPCLYRVPGFHGWIAIFWWFIHDYSWLFMIIHDYSCLFMIIHDYSWLFMVIHDYSWLFMVIHDYSWLFMVIHGYSPISQTKPSCGAKADPKRLHLAALASISTLPTPNCAKAQWRQVKYWKATLANSSDHLKNALWFKKYIEVS